MDVRNRLKTGKPLLFDGAMGTYYASLPGNAGKRCETANLQYPETVLEIHRAYLAAGSRALTTNTFAASADLAAGVETAAVKALVKAGIRLAREAADGTDAYVFGCIGPAPEDSCQSAADIYRRQAEWFLEEGISCFLMETQSSDAGIPDTARFIHEHCNAAYVIVSYAAGTDGMTTAGFSGRELYTRTVALPDVDAAGFNCVMGPGHLLEYIKTLPRTGKPLSVMPNAGYPAVVGRRVTFGGSPDYFGNILAQIAAQGSCITGGCCGTTPEHIAAAAKILRNMEILPDRQISAPSDATSTPSDEISMPLSGTSAPSVEIPRIIVYPRNEQKLSGTEQNEHKNEQDVSAKFAAGERVIAVELDPPPDDDAAYFFNGVRTLRNAGADWITIADCPVGRPRADSSLLACKVKRDFGMEPLPHIACRDRNLNATKALLLGLAIEGIHHILIVTGDPVPTEKRDEVKSVFNFNSRKLARYIQSLNETLQTPFQMFGALNVNARNFDRQLEFALEKETCGITGFLTQPVLSPEAMDNLRKARTVLHGKILGGIFPVVSYRNACFLNNEIAGMRVSEDIIRRYEGLNREEAESLAVEISIDTAREIADFTDGLYLMTPFKRVALVEKILSLL